MIYGDGVQLVGDKCFETLLGGLDFHGGRAFRFLGLGSVDQDY